MSAERYRSDAARCCLKTSVFRDHKQERDDDAHGRMRRARLGTAVASAIFLIIELRTPYSGLLQLSLEPIVTTIAALGKSRSVENNELRSRTDSKFFPD